MGTPDFISVEKARQLISDTEVRLSTEKVKLKDALGRTLAEDIFSGINSPPFPQSVRDGYAVIYHDIRKKGKIKIIREIKAGDIAGKRITSGQGVRIYTGAPVPEGADTVIMQEYATVSKGFLEIKKDSVTRNEYINHAGSQRKKGELALQKGTQLSAASIGFLSGLGIKNLAVFKEPVISLIITGNELQQAGKSLKNGRIYDAVSPMLVSALRSVNFKGNIKIKHCRDTFPQLLATFKKAVKESDLVITTGGISVGEYDLLGKVFGKAKVKTIFYKVKQKPGKPLYFGKHDNTVVFGLPGNPAAVLTCFYEYVNPVLQKIKGHSSCFPTSLFLPVAEEYHKKNGLAFFLKGLTNGISVAPLANQESFSLDTFSQANCLIYLPEDKAMLNKGELAEVHLLP